MAEQYLRLIDQRDAPPQQAVREADPERALSPRSPLPKRCRPRPCRAALDRPVYDLVSTGPLQFAASFSVVRYLGIERCTRLSSHCPRSALRARPKRLRPERAEPGRKPPRRHPLRRLWQRLPQHTRTQIIDRVSRHRCAASRSRAARRISDRHRRPVLDHERHRRRRAPRL